MSKVQATLGAAVAIFGFNPDPETPSSRALHLLTVRGGLPRADLDPRERFAEGGARAAREAGVDLDPRKGNKNSRLHLVGLDDAPSRSRMVTAWYYATAAFETAAAPGRWVSAGRGLKLDAADTAAVKAAMEQLRSDTRHVAGAAALIGEVFTGDDLLRLHVCLHGGPEGSERTFRRRVQELRDSGVLRSVRDNEVPALRLRIPRFRSPAGTGGRPPELLRYSGSGGEDEQLAALRARRVS